MEKTEIDKIITDLDLENVLRQIFKNEKTKMKKFMAGPFQASDTSDRMGNTYTTVFILEDDERFILQLSASLVRVEMYFTSNLWKKLMDIYQAKMGENDNIVMQLKSHLFLILLPYIKNLLPVNPMIYGTNITRRKPEDILRWEVENGAMGYVYNWQH